MQLVQSAHTSRLVTSVGTIMSPSHRHHALIDERNMRAAPGAPRQQRSDRDRSNRPILWPIVIAAVAFAASWAGSASTAPITIGDWYRTGFGKTPGNVPANSLDGAWTIQAWAADGTFQSGSAPTAGSPAYVFESNVSGSLGIPNVWLGGNSNEGFVGALWIGLQNSPFGVINSPTSTFPGDFRSSMVLKTTFNASAAGTALLDFWSASDNAVAFFVGGTITTSTNEVVDPGSGLDPGWQTGATGSNFPTIAGGQQVGFGRGFSVLTHYTAYANVVEGSNDFYAVVYDSVAGSENWTGLLFTPVPEPSSVVLAGIAVGCIAYSHRRSRRRRHPRRTAAGSPARDDGRPAGDVVSGAAHAAE